MLTINCDVRTIRIQAICAAALLFNTLGMTAMVVRAEETKVAVTFSDGHETDRRDGGRPVVLIAAALGVKTEVFREAFSGVTPARNGRPTGEQARANKQALMKVLKPHGITNDRLDEVSDYYRYRPQNGELWKHTSAKAHAIVENGQVKKIVVTEPGSGYSSEPHVVIDGMTELKLKASIKFDTDLKKNGSIRSIEIVQSDEAKSGR